MSPVLVKRLAVVGWDALSWTLAALAYFILRFDLEISDRVWHGVLAYTALAIVLQLLTGFVFHLYLGRSRLGSFDELRVADLYAGSGALLLLIGAASAAGVGPLAMNARSSASCARSTALRSPPGCAVVTNSICDAISRSSVKALTSDAMRSVYTRRL